VPNKTQTAQLSGLQKHLCWQAGPNRQFNAETYIHDVLYFCEQAFLQLKQHDHLTMDIQNEGCNGMSHEFSEAYLWRSYFYL
jgi:hypothetical protein